MLSYRISELFIFKILKKKFSKTNYYFSLLFSIIYTSIGASQVALVVKNMPVNAGDQRDSGSIPGWGRSPGEGSGNHCRILAWKIPSTPEPGGL